MQSRTTIEKIKAHSVAIQTEGITALYVVDGSRARGTHRPNSDLDVFV
jgi:predicted nucleotidyltransferase